MKPGKLPPHLLASLLAQVPPGERVIVGPRYGADAAVLEVRPDRLLVAKCDPITFATEVIGWYAVAVNGNDLAVSGARPLWFLATVLLPPGAGEQQAREIFAQLLAACADQGIALVGGHTEITLGLDRPVVVGCMLGEVEPGRVVTSAGARPGDALLLTKGIAVEGTALLAREAAEALAQAGVSRPAVQRAAELLVVPGISVAREAQALCQQVSVHAMHDPTEGGLATGLAELAAASGVGLRVERCRVPVLPETQEVCQALGLDPWGLIASGSVLAAVAPQEADHALAALRALGIAAEVIGAVTAPEAGLVLVEPDGGERPLPSFERDEVARFLEGTP